VSDLGDWIAKALGARMVSFAVFSAAVCLLINPLNLIDSIGLTDFAVVYRDWIGLAALLFGFYFLASMFVFLGGGLKKH